jgi:hypothetical protein
MKFCRIARLQERMQGYGDTINAVLLGTSLSGKAKLNSSETAANGFDANRAYLQKLCAAANSSSLETKVTLTRVSRGEVGRVHYTLQ